MRAINKIIGKSLFSSLKFCCLVLLTFSILGYNISLSNVENLKIIILTYSKLIGFLLVLISLNTLYFGIIPFILKTYCHKILKKRLIKKINELSKEELEKVKRLASVLVAKFLIKVPIELGFIRSDEFKDEIDETIPTIGEKIDLMNDILSDVIRFFLFIHLILITISVVFISNWVWLIILFVLSMLLIYLMKYVFYVVIIIAMFSDTFINSHHIIRRKLHNG